MTVERNARIETAVAGMFRVLLGKALCLGTCGSQCERMTEHALVCVAFRVSLPWCAPD